jgi:glycerol kinase
MKYILALDQGTTSSRAMLFDHSGAICGMAQREFEQLFPQSGWVEHNPNDIWASQIYVIEEVLTAANIQASDLAAVGITNQRETTLVWNRRTGEPIHNAIVWQDRRTTEICERLKADGLESLFRERTGLMLDPYFSGTKVRWILDQVEGAQQSAENGELAFGTVDSWLIWNLTDGKLHCTDASNASRTLLFNLNSGNWDDELLAHLNIPKSLMPEINSSSEFYGEVTHPILSNVPISGIAGDQQAALFGQACLNPGMAKNTYGTGCFVLLNTGLSPVISQHELVSTVAWNIEDISSFALEGSVFVGGAAVQWLRDGLGIIDEAAEVEALAGSVPDSGGIYVVPAFTGLGAPHWDPHARGTIVGISRGTTSAHIARATLEGIVLQVADVLSAMQADSGISLSELRVDGGAAMNNLLMQCQADVLGVPVVRPTITETTALGAAYLAGLAVDYWSNTDEIASQWSVDRIFEPEMSQPAVDQLKEGWSRALERSKGWAH